MWVSCLCGSGDSKLSPRRGQLVTVVPGVTLWWQSCSTVVPHLIGHRFWLLPPLNTAPDWDATGAPLPGESCRSSGAGLCRGPGTSWPSHELVKAGRVWASPALPRLQPQLSTLPTGRGAWDFPAYDTMLSCSVMPPDMSLCSVLGEVKTLIPSILV